MKILGWVGNNILSIFTILLLALIPLYPKIPLVDIQNTWVYVRLEDFAVVATVLTWVILLLFKKVSLKTPLTIPIFLFWIIGGLATLHGVMILFPTLANVFPNVAFLSFLRRVEYMSMFFIAFSSMKSKKYIIYIAVTLTLVLLAIVTYGFGQKYLGFPAYLTMNEEFAKGVPIRLSELSRVPSTFAGQYDLAAYLVLIIPIIVSLAFGFKNMIVKLSLLAAASLGFALLFLTVSRVSFFALLLSLLLLLIIQKKRLIVFSLLVLTLALLVLSPSLLQRFRSTVSEINVLVDAKTGGAIGQVKEVPATYFENKVIKKMLMSKDDATVATGSAVVPSVLIPPTAYLVIEANASTGENLPQGTSYVNLPLSPVMKKIDAYYSQKEVEKDGVKKEEIDLYDGDYLIKKARAYDLSFTTRFQGEWPNTFRAFKRNIFLGSGYGSVSLAVDNNYLRILGESGILGLIGFLSIFIVAVIYIRKIWPRIDSPIAKSFVVGFAAGSFGLAINAFLIDVFDASKIAFTYWLLMGITIGILHFYRKEEVNILKEFRKVVTSPFAVIFYILIAIVVLYSPMLSNYFVGDDFTWFRWASENNTNILNHFTQSNGFFYRPGTKIFFSLMYSSFWLNQAMYHIVSLLLHFAVSTLLFLTLRKVLKNYSLSIISVALFVVLSGYHEDIFWISSIGFIFTAFFALLSLLSYVYFREKGKLVYLTISFVSIIFGLCFHELGIVIPLLIILYDLIFDGKIISKVSRKITYLIILFPILPYLVMRYISSSHWLNGDYGYNLLKLPYNILGNSIGYMFLDLFGPQSVTIYESVRNYLKANLPLAALFSIGLIIGLVILYRIIIRKLDDKDRRAVIFGLGFFLIALIPFLGLGNMSSRYSYLSSVGFVILLAIFFKKVYNYLVNVGGRYIGIACIVIIVIIYSMIQLISLQKIHTDWKVAGQKSQKFLISVERYSKDFWIRQKMSFYFVDMPIKNGDAWVWPVGLKDALWFTFKNPNISVTAVPDINTAFNLAGNSPDSHVFVFDSDGNVDEMVRAQDGEISPLNHPKDK